MKEEVFVKNFTFLIGILVVLALMTSKTFSQVPSGKNLQVVDLVTRAYKAPPSKFLFKEFNDSGFHVGFVHDGSRFDFFYNYYFDGISFVVGLNDSISPWELLVDEDVDSTVDFGQDGYCRSFTEQNFYFDGNELEGEEFRCYWQEVYDKALVALREILR